VRPANPLSDSRDRATGSESEQRLNRWRIGTAIAATTLLLTIATVAQVGSDLKAAKKQPACKGEPATIVLRRSQIGSAVYGTASRDIVVGTSGPDEFHGKGGGDLVCLRGGDDAYLAGADAGVDEVYGGPGNDGLGGGGGNDELFGGRGNDGLWGEDGNDLCDGGRGTDEVPPVGSCEKVIGTEFGP
jgi:Ca2+-binding RTX toxin-like protein